MTCPNTGREKARVGNRQGFSVKAAVNAHHPFVLQAFSMSCWL